MLGAAEAMGLGSQLRWLDRLLLSQPRVRFSKQKTAAFLEIVITVEAT